MTAKEIYDKAAKLALDKLADEEKQEGKGFFETGIPFASPKQEADALQTLGYTPDDLLSMEHDEVLGEVLRQLKLGTDKWEPIDYDALEGKVTE